MARGYLPVPLSPMAGGVNRFEKESAPTQAAEALDVVNDKGNIRRRGGMSTFAAGAPHHLPAGATNVVTEAGDAYANLADRAGGIVGKSSFYVGCDEKFDGVDWPGSGPLSNLPPNDSYYLEASYWNGSAWTAIPFILDTTHGRPTYAFSTVLSAAQRTVALSLTQHGHISWHATEHLSDWATVAVNSVTKYYVRLTLKSAGSTVTALTGTTINNPGVRAFKLAPVNGLFPVKLKDRAVLVIGTDRARRGGVTRRGVELGAQLGYHTNDEAKAETAILVLDEGAATIGTKSPTDWNGSGTWPAELGTSSVLEKTKKTFLDENLNVLDYEWLYSTPEPQLGQFLGSVILETLSRTASTTTTIKLQDASTTAVTDNFENCRIRTTTADGGGPAAGEEREIVSYDSDSGYTVYPAWSAAPVADDVYAIYSPHATVRFDAPTESIGVSVAAAFSSGATVTRNWEVASHLAHSITPVDGSAVPYAEDPDVTTFQMTDFEVGRELRWSTVGGKRWCGAYDSMTGRLILTNGESPLLAFDGRRLRELVADDSSDAAKELAGQLPEAWWGLEYGGTSQKAQLMTADAIFRPAPPLGAYIVDYMGRLVVADPQTNVVAWSMPVLYNDIWPMHFEHRIRDDENNAITGLATLRDQLYVFTSSAIFASGPADARGNFGFYRASHGIGFVSHHAVERIPVSGSSTLIGAAADGVYMFNGSDPVPILEDWKRVLPEGVNRSAMDDACATVSLTENKYYLAVPSAGSDRNDRILVFDWIRKQWWVFSAPYGVASLATDYDENGDERVLIGTYDGHVAQFSRGGTDDGTVVTGVARSIAIAPGGASGREGSFIALTLDMKNMGTNTVTVNTYTDRQQISRESSSSLSKTLKVDASLDVWGTGVWGTAQWGDSRTKTVRLNMPTSARGHTIQYEISGSASWELNSATIFVRPLGPRGRR